MNILDLDGSAYERGRGQGEKMGEQYRRLMADFFSSEMWHENKPGFLPDGLLFPALGLLGRFNTRGPVSAHLPAQAERVRGLAAGLGISEQLCWGLQFMEIMMCTAGKSMKVPGGCTQIHAASKATAEGKPLCGRNYDFPNLLRPYQLIRREIPAEAGRFATTTVTQAPLAGAHQGVNEQGLSVCVNNSRQWKGPDLRFKGVPYQFILMEALETCRTTAEVVKLITEFPCRANAGFFGIADAAGDIRVVEFTASRWMVREPDEAGVAAQTNHFIKMTEANLPEGTHWVVEGMEGLEYAFSTETRYRTAYEKLRERAGQITVETMMEILWDHSANDGVGADHTVCCHGLTGSTLGSMIVDTRGRKMWVADGNPCEAPYEEIEFRAKT